jgi:hypothetical protein
VRTAELPKFFGELEMIAAIPQRSNARRHNGNEGLRVGLWDMNRIDREYGEPQFGELSARLSMSTKSRYMLYPLSRLDCIVALP